MKKRIVHIVGMILEMLLFAGAFVVQYFTNKKMGMARHVIFKNQTWEKAYPLEQWKLLSVVILAVLLVLVLILLIRKRKNLSRWAVAEGIIMTIMTLFSLYFTLGNSAATLRPYYFMSPMFAAAALIQIIRTGLPVLKHKA